MSRLLAQPSQITRVSSRDQVGCQRSRQEAQIQGRKLQGSAPRPSPASRVTVPHSLGASFPGFGLPGGCASSRLDHGLKFYEIQGGAVLAAD